MKKSMTTPEARLIRVGEHACIGHLLASRGGAYRAFDPDDKEIGTYPTPDLAVAALLEHATEAA